ncbi:hypothetical protein LWC34_47480 [Kibdelosporangium philippinense]|uniref:Uncharacterized protein n=2 Tax=Kibdelosporangium philippinense TaxID=211113 RepID=A0ABS8ZVF5_9PSEU|nr:hypothetical protein [Kibdelosporangium philippinense]MCE7010398.1 hypothetical protein [Kibdelosporangium philippinense]
MKVFVSSEHEELPAMVHALGHQISPLAYADVYLFTSRGADQNFDEATRLGIPIIGFRQAGAAGNGQFAEFSSVPDLLVKVVTALRNVPAKREPLVWQPLSRVRSHSGLLMSQEQWSRVTLALHVIQVNALKYTAAQVRDLPDRMVRAIRESGLVADADELVQRIEYYETTVSCPSALAEPGGFGGARMAVNADMAAWEILPTGGRAHIAFIDEDSATAILTRLVGLIGRLTTNTEQVVPVVELKPLKNLGLGDPATMFALENFPRPHQWNHDSITSNGDEALTAPALATNAPEVARELALQLLDRLRRTENWRRY